MFNFGEGVGERGTGREVGGLKECGEPLPESMNELQMMYMHSGLEYKGKNAMFMRKRQQRGHESYVKKKRLRYIKWGKM